MKPHNNKWSPVECNDTQCDDECCVLYKELIKCIEGNPSKLSLKWYEERILRHGLDVEDYQLIVESIIKYVDYKNNSSNETTL